MQEAYEIMRQQGDINHEWNKLAIVEIIGQCHQFSREVWKMIADTETEATERQRAQEEANKRAEE
jgi:hypothetical protein